MFSCTACLNQVRGLAGLPVQTNLGGELPQRHPVSRLGCSMHAGHGEGSSICCYLFSLDVVLHLGDLDLHGIQFFVRHEWDVGHCLRLIHSLEGEVCERNVPFTIILLAFPEKKWGQDFKHTYTSSAHSALSMSPPGHFSTAGYKIVKWAQPHCNP